MCARLQEVGDDRPCVPDVRLRLLLRQHGVAPRCTGQYGATARPAARCAAGALTHPPCTNAAWTPAHVAGSVAHSRATTTTAQNQKGAGTIRRANILSSCAARPLRQRRIPNM